MRPRAPRRILLASIALLGWTGNAPAAERVYPSPEAVEPLAVGRPVPSAELHTVHGEPVALTDLVQERGALLVFYRGGW